MEDTESELAIFCSRQGFSGGTGLHYVESMEKGSMENPK